MNSETFLIGTSLSRSRIDESLYPDLLTCNLLTNFHDNQLGVTNDVPTYMFLTEIIKRNITGLVIK